MAKKNKEKSVFEDKMYEYVYEAYKQNTILLNTSLLAVPAVMAPVLFSYLGELKNDFSKIFFIFGGIAFIISVLIMLRSFFKANTFARLVIERKKEESEKVRERLELMHEFVYWAIFIGFVFIVLGLFSTHLVCQICM